MKLNDILTIFYPVLYTFLVGFLAYVGKEIVKLVPTMVEALVAKIGLTNYQKTKAIAWDIWNVIEEHFRISQVVGDTVNAKITMFETLIKQKVPGITDTEIETVRQAIAGEFNKDKPIVQKEIDNPVETVAVSPTIKYVAPDGTELTPVVPTPTVL